MEKFDDIRGDLRSHESVIERQLEPSESVLASFDPDLDAQLHYADSQVILTDRRLISIERASGTGGREPAAATTLSWRLQEIVALKAKDRAALGILELEGPAGRLAFWRYTAARTAEAHRFVQQFEAYRRGEGPDDTWEEIPPPELAEPRRAHAGALLRLLKFTRPWSVTLALGLLLTLATTVAGLIPPYLTGPLADNVLVPYLNQVDTIRASQDLTPQQKEAQLTALKQQSSARMRLVARYLGAMGCAYMLAWLLNWGQGVVMSRVSERVVAELRSYTYAHLQRLSLEFFGGRRTGDLVSRLSTDTERICNFLADNLVDFVTDVLLIIGTTAVLLWINPQLTAATLLPVPIVGWLIYYVRGKLQRGFQRGGRAWGEMTSVLADTIPGIRVIKAFAQEKREIERFRRSNDRIVEANDRVNVVWTFFWPMVVMLNSVGLLVVWGFGAWLIFVQQITRIGVLFQFLVYVGRLYSRLESMSRMFLFMHRAAAGAQRVYEVLDRVPSVPEPASPVPISRMRGEIEFRDVSFHHGTRPILQDIQLRIEPAEVIGLVGPSGAGKSTLVNLVCRFYDADQGAVLVDGVDIRSFSVTEYRKHIGIVLQDPFLFYGTVAENIAYGKPDASRDEIIAAARAARAHEFILRLPLGYDSLVGERGQALSGGERQRISIARAILIDPRILILDEATSSVDTETEREIQEALDNLIEGRTTIAIAHRLSTLSRADRIVVLEHGRIVEIGQHHELLQAGGVYARLYQAQQELSLQEGR